MAPVPASQRIPGQVSYRLEPSMDEHWNILRSQCACLRSGCQPSYIRLIHSWTTPPTADLSMAGIPKAGVAKLQPPCLLPVTRGSQHLSTSSPGQPQSHQHDAKGMSYPNTRVTRRASVTYLPLPHFVAIGIELYQGELRRVGHPAQVD